MADPENKTETRSESWWSDFEDYRAALNSPLCEWPDLHLPDSAAAAEGVFDEMDEEYKKKFQGIYDELTKIEGLSTTVRVMAVRKMQEYARNTEPYDKLFKHAKAAKFDTYSECLMRAPCPFDLQAEDPATRKTEEMDETTFFKRLTDNASGGHAGDQKIAATETLDWIAAHYELLLNFKPLTDQENQTVEIIFKALDADQDGTISFSEMELILIKEVFSEDLVKKKWRHMDLRRFTEFMTFVKHNRSTKWNDGLLNKFMEKIQEDTDAAGRAAGAKDVKGYQGRFETGARQVGTSRQEDPGRQSESTQAREEQCSCNGCVLS